MIKHQKLAHMGEEPKFLFKVISTHKTALQRQIKEAVRIRRRGGAANILNSRSEFNRCHIPKLIVEQEEEGAKKIRIMKEREEEAELTRCLEQDDIPWETRKRMEQ